MLVDWLTWKCLVFYREGVVLGRGAITVPPRPTRSIVVIKGSARRVFGRVSSVIGRPAASLSRRHKNRGPIKDE